MLQCVHLDAHTRPINRIIPDYVCQKWKNANIETTITWSILIAFGSFKKHIKVYSFDISGTPITFPVLCGKICFSRNISNTLLWKMTIFTKIRLQLGLHQRLLVDKIWIFWLTSFFTVSVYDVETWYCAVIRKICQNSYRNFAFLRTFYFFLHFPADDRLLPSVRCSSSLPRSNAKNRT